jgi:predicted membrane protein
VGVVLIVDAFLQQIGAAALWKILVIIFAVVLTFWIASLAFADILATQRHFSQLRQQLLHEEARFLAELRHAKTKTRHQSGANSGNGKAFRGNRTKTSS